MGRGNNFARTQKQTMAQNCSLLDWCGIPVAFSISVPAATPGCAAAALKMVGIWTLYTFIAVDMDSLFFKVSYVIMYIDTRDKELFKHVLHSMSKTHFNIQNKYGPAEELPFGERLNET